MSQKINGPEKCMCFLRVLQVFPWENKISLYCVCVSVRETERETETETETETVREKENMCAH